MGEKCIFCGKPTEYAMKVEGGNEISFCLSCMKNLLLHSADIIAQIDGMEERKGK